MRKRSLAWVLTLVMLLSILPLGAAAQGFTDVQAGSYYETPVGYGIKLLAGTTSDFGFSAAHNKVCSACRFFDKRRKSVKKSPALLGAGNSFCAKMQNCAKVFRKLFIILSFFRFRT